MFSRSWSVFRIETQQDEIRSSDQIAWSRALIRREPLLLEQLGTPASGPATGSPRAAGRRPASSRSGRSPPRGRRRAPGSAGVLVEPGGVLDHDRVDDARLRPRLEDLGAVRVVGREADELRLARLLDRLDRLLEFLALWTNSIASSSGWWSPMAWMKKRSTWSVLRCLQPLVEHARSGRGAGRGSPW